MQKTNLSYKAILGVILVIVMFLFQPTGDAGEQVAYTIPDFSGEPYVVLGDNVPTFTAQELEAEPFETYEALDELGRCTVAYGCLDRSLMPIQSRGDISTVRPTGWKNHPYDFIDGEMVYNRCHLIAHMLTGEDANERNLITGTRYMNTMGMLPFENMVADHIKEENHRVLYRVKPHFYAEELVCRGVQMEAQCIDCSSAPEEDRLQFHVYCYNVQPGVVIDYATGENTLDETAFEGEARDYILNTSSMKFHLPTCPGAQSVTGDNRREVTCSREELRYKGYAPCGSCNP